MKIQLKSCLYLDTVKINEDSEENQIWGHGFGGKEFGLWIDGMYSYPSLPPTNSPKLYKPPLQDAVNKNI